MSDSKEPIRLRKRKLADGKISLYLDVYLNGNRSYEFLKMYLVPEHTRADKEKNRETLRLADAVRAKRIVELRNGEYGFKGQDGSDVNFWEYYDALVEKRWGEETKGNWGNWRSCKKHLQRYEKRKNLTFKDTTTEWVEGFKRYLDREAYAFGCDYRKRKEHFPLSQNSKYSYLNKLRALFRQAYEEGIILRNPFRGVEGFSVQDGTRMYLTIDEVKRAAAAYCQSELIKRAFLFSCLTGLRRSDVLKLQWSEVSEQSGFTRIIFRQKKTKGQEYLDITPQAAELLGERGKPDERPFANIPCTSTTNRYIKEWLLRAGIDKQITFHCARHTFAVMMLDLGTDIYTVSKLLGHRELTTTQIYAKVLDKNKQAAVAAIPSIFPSEEEKNESED